MKNSTWLLWLTLVVVLIGTVGTPPVSGGPLLVFQSASAEGNHPMADSASSSSSGGGWKSRLISAEPLLEGGVRFVFLVPSGEFKIEESPDLLGGNWRPLPSEEFKMIREIREDNVDSQDRLTLILPKAAGKQRFLRLIPLK